MSALAAGIGEYMKQTADRLYKELVAKATGPATFEDVTKLPTELQEALCARKSDRMAKTRRYFGKFCTRWKWDNLDDHWKELIEINRYLRARHDMFVKKGKRDDTPKVLYSAGVPSTLLRVVHSGFDEDYIRQNVRVEAIINYAIEILTTFFDKNSPLFLLYAERFFRGPRQPIEEMVRILEYKLSFANTFAAIRFFGVASFTPPCMFFFEKNPDVFRTVCTYVYDTMSVANIVISTEQVTWQNLRILPILMAFRSDSDLHLTTRLLALYTTCHAIYAFSNVLMKSRPDIDLFYKMLKIVRRSKIVKHFTYTVKNLMQWVEPQEHINNLLMGMRDYLNLEGAFDELFFTDFDYCDESRIEKGIESIKYMTHSSLYPSRLSWFLVHCLCLDEAYGHGWALHILCFVFQNYPQEKGDVFIKLAGNELMDLAHLIDATGPSNCMVQATLLQALLRYAGFSHKLYNIEDSYEGTLKPLREIPECCLEAALFCKRAAVEGRMPIEARQRNIVLADELKHLGNAAFKEGHYKAAIDKYTEAIALCPLSAQIKQAVYYSNRAECHLKTGHPMKAVHDCNRSLCLDTSAKVKVQWRRSRAYQQLGLLYPAWLDMKCIEKEWNMTKEQSGVDFPQLLKTVSDELGMYSPSLFSPMEKLIWKPCAYEVPP